MANGIYTTDNKAIIGAGPTKSVTIPNPEANKDVHTIVAVNNGNIGGLFATVLHSYDGTNYKYKLYFLPNINFNNSLIFADLPGGNGDVIEFKKTTRRVETNRFWHLLHRNVRGSSPEIFTVNDITKIQGKTTTAVKTTSGGVPQDVLAAFYNNKKNVLLIKDILSVETTSTQTANNITPYTGKHFTTNFNDSEYVIEIKIANHDEKYLFTQEQANQSHNTRYTSGGASSESEYTNIGSTQPNSSIGSPEFPGITTESRKRWGTNRQNLFFREEWMKIKANELYSDVLDTRMRVSLIPSLTEFMRYINGTVADTTANEKEILAKEKSIVQSDYLTARIKRNTTQTEKNSFSNNNTGEIILTGERDLEIVINYILPPAASYEHPKSSELTVLNASSSTVGVVDRNPKFETSQIHPPAYRQRFRRASYKSGREFTGYKTVRLYGNSGYNGWYYSRGPGGLGYTVYPGYYNSQEPTYKDVYRVRETPESGYLPNFTSFEENLYNSKNNVSTITTGFNSIGQAEVIRILKENFSSSRNFLKIPLRTYQVVQKERYSKLDVQVFSITGDEASYPTRRFATRDNSDNVYIVDEKTNSQTIILKVI
tara:strand:- start:5970 stop:7766 length:1797 start_codon:yes stop_codon:yes gene_type:complete